MAQDTLAPIQPPTVAASQRLMRTLVSTIAADSFEIIRSAAIIGNDLLAVGVTGSNMFANIDRFNLWTGRLLERLTRQGRGPGEVSAPHTLTRMAGDSLFAYDDRQGRFTVFAPGSYKYVRSGTIASLDATVIVPMRAGRLLVAATVVSREAVGFPLHLFDAAGNHLKSFGGPGQSFPRRTSGVDPRVVTATSDDQIWAITFRGPTVIERYSAGGELSLVIPYSPGAEIRSLPPPAPRMARRSILSMDGRHLWILSTVADRDWRRGTVSAAATGRQGTGEMRVGSWSLLYDSVVDVVDVRSGTIVARRRVDELITQILPGGYVILHSESPDGEPIIRVERWSLRSQ